MPDPDRHIHFVIANVTFDETEDKWKAVKFRPIMDLRKFFDRTFDSILAAKLTGLGYEIETKWKSDGRAAASISRGTSRASRPGSSRIIRGGRGRSTRPKRPSSRRRQEHNPEAPDRLSAVARDQLGATSRREKREDVTLGECRQYWDSRISPEDSDAIADTIRRAMLGQNARPEPMAAKALDFAMRHHFEQHSAVPVEQLVTTAIEHSMGAATPADIERELTRQGVIIATIDGVRQATTEALQREEEYLTGFAAAGRGSVRSVGVADGLTRRLEGGKTLNDGQWDAVCGLLHSENRVDLVEGPAGAGKSFLLRKFDEGMRMAGQSVTYLADHQRRRRRAGKGRVRGRYAWPASCSMTKMQAAAAGGRVVVDETSMLGHKDAVKLFQSAKRLDLKLIFVGDPMQHGSGRSRGA